MAWTTPLTATANAPLTASQWNASVRDNLNETAVAKATTAGSIFVATGLNSIAQRTLGEDTEFAAESTTSSTYANLSTVGAVITATTGGRVLVGITSDLNNNTAGGASYVSYEITGATAAAADDNYSLSAKCEAAPTAISMARASSFRLRTGITSGSNTFTMKYRVTSGTTGTFNERSILVIPL